MLNEEYMDSMKRLDNYEKLDKQGKLIVLPCAIGTKVYIIKSYLDCKNNYECQHYDRWGTGKCSMCQNEYTSFYISDRCIFDLSMLDKIGESIFLNFEEAEKKLEELKK